VRDQRTMSMGGGGRAEGAARGLHRWDEAVERTGRHAG
jgi:hypothetical protein